MASEPENNTNDADVPSAEAVASEALESAKRATASIGEAVGAAVGSGVGGQAVAMPEFASRSDAASAAGLHLLSDVNLHVKVELGRTRMLVEDVLRLATDSVVELDKLAGDPVDIYVNDRHVARGEVLVVNENFCVRVSEIIQQAQGED